jgi:protocatechuate 4,5-dioxygenase alpha chain
VAPRNVANTARAEYVKRDVAPHFHVAAGRLCGNALEGETPMAAKPKENEYEDIPGTFVFNAERSRQGYGINMFCMSLMKEANRKAFKANEAGYLKQFPLTPEQTDAVLKRDYNRMLELGGNIYFTAKLGATDGHSFRHLAAVMTGSTQDDYAKMMLAGGRSVEGNRSKSGKYEKPAKTAAAKTTPKPKAKQAKPKSKSAKKRN